MYNRFSPPTLAAIRREMVRETKESAFASAPGRGAGALYILALTQLLLFLSLLPAHTHMPQNAFSSSFVPLVFCPSGFLQPLNFSIVLRTWF